MLSFSNTSLIYELPVLQYAIFVFFLLIFAVVYFTSDVTDQMLFNWNRFLEQIHEKQNRLHRSI